MLKAGRGCAGVEVRQPSVEVKNAEKLSIPSTADGLTGSRRVAYNPHEFWDWYCHLGDSPADLNLRLPHFRSRWHPPDERLHMYVGSQRGSVKLKICRPVHRIRFYAYIRSNSGDVTVWVPSDFTGTIIYDGKAKLSAGFINRIIHRVDFDDEDAVYEPDQDTIIVETTGKVTFRMWDCVFLRPENPRKETLKRLFSCLRRQPVAPALMDWNFLLDD